MLSPLFSIPVCRYPMTGLQLTTSSPSSSSSSRSTPCVEGCWGPMLMWSVCGRVSSAIDLARHREIDRLDHGRLISPQRVALPIVWQHDPGQLRMADEAHPVQVPDLALVPVDRREA